MKYYEEFFTLIFGLIIITMLLTIPSKASGQDEDDLVGEFILSGKEAAARFEQGTDGSIIMLMWETNVYCYELKGKVDSAGTILALTMPEAGNLGRCAALDIVARGRGLRDGA